MNRIFRQLLQVTDSPRSLPVLLLFSAVLTGALFVARLEADLNFDGEIYISAAMKFESGMYREGLAIYPMPLYPCLISLVHKIVPDWVLAGRLISYFFMTLTVIPLYLLSRDLFNHRAAFWSCLTFALLPETLLNSNSVLRDPGFFLFFTFSIYFAQKVLHAKRKVHLIASAFFALVSTLFRIEGLIVFPVVFFFLGGLSVAKGTQGRDHLKLWLVWSGLFTCLVMLIVFGVERQGVKVNRYGEWLAYSHSLKDQSLLESYHRVSDQLKQMQDVSVNRDIGQHFAETARKLIWVIYLLGMLQLLTAVFLAVNIIPLIWGIIHSRYYDRHVFVLLSAACLLGFIYGFFIQHDLLIKRYLFMPAVLLCPWIGYGIDTILEFARKRPYGNLLTVFFVLVLLGFPAAEFDKYFKSTDTLKSQVGSWIAKQEGFKNSTIVFSDQVLKFYADMKKDIRSGTTTLLRWDPDDRDFSRIGRFAIENKADAFVLYSRMDRKNSMNEFAGYEPIKEFGDDNKIIKIFVSRERRFLFPE